MVYVPINLYIDKNEPIEIRNFPRPGGKVKPFCCIEIGEKHDACMYFTSLQQVKVFASEILSQIAEGVPDAERKK